MADEAARSIDLPRMRPEHRIRLRVVARAVEKASEPPTLSAHPSFVLSRSSDLWGVGPAGWLGAGLLYGFIAIAAILIGWRVAPPQPWPESQAVFKVVFEEPPAAPAPAPEPAPPREAAQPAPEPVAAAPEPQPLELPKPPPAKPMAPRPRLAAKPPPVEPANSGATEPRVAALTPPTAPVVPPRPVGSVAGNPKPLYPTEARERGFEGTVVLHVDVSAAGRPLQVTVLSSSGHASLDRAALNAVERWRFEPAMQAGQAIAAAANVPVQFRLED